MTADSGDIASLPGLGKVSAQWIAEAGINSKATFLSCNPFLLYQKIKQIYPSTSLNMLYAIMGAQQNCHWQEIAQTQKMEILMRLDDMGLSPK